MSLAILDSAGARALLDARLGVDATSDEGVADLLRAEVHARGQAARALTLERVVRMAGPALALAGDRVAEVCETLVREGDFVLATGGLLAATPLRMVPLPDGSARVFCSAPTPAVRAWLGDDVVRAGARRSIPFSSVVADLAERSGGRVVAPEQWAGFLRTAPADRAFLDRIDARLEWEPEPAGSLESAEELDWRGWSPAASPPGWRREAPEARLWMAKTQFRWRRYAWTGGGGSPATRPFVSLGADEANRAQFSLLRDTPARPSACLRSEGAGCAADLPAWLPLAEYRWLSLHGEQVGGDAGHRRWLFASAAAESVTTMLTERLGFSVETAE